MGSASDSLRKSNRGFAARTRTGMLLLAGAFLGTSARESAAVPAFARKYRTSCTTCHVAIFKRNAFGEAFRRNGYVMPERDARLIKEAPVSLGAEAWKEAWPEAIWPGDLPGAVPLSVFGLLPFTYERRGAEGDVHAAFDTPFVEIVLAGAFGSSIGFFGEAAVGDDVSNSATVLRRFLVQLNDVVGPPNAVNVRVGRFEPGITDGYTSTQRLTLAPVITLDYRAAGWRPRDLQVGIELNGIVSHRLSYAAGVVNGNGRTADDLNNRKDVYARVAYKLGGTGFDGPFDGQWAETSRDDSLTLGLHAYQGSSTNPTAPQTGEHPFRRLGADARLQEGRWDLLGGLLLGQDDNPAGNDRRLRSLVWFLEADRIFYPWLIGVIRLEQASSETEDERIDDYTNVVSSVTALLRPNVRISVEGLVTVKGAGAANTLQVYPNGLRSIKCSLLLAF